MKLTVEQLEGLREAVEVFKREAQVIEEHHSHEWCGEIVWVSEDYANDHARFLRLAAVLEGIK